jgi:hypothetical protein
LKATVQEVWGQLKEVSWRSLSWLTAGLTLFGLCFFIWIWLQVSARQTIQITTPDDTPEPKTVAERFEGFDASLGGMTDLVPVLDLSKAMVQAGTHGPEFRGADFLTRHAKSWTLQLMNVTQESVIADFLAGRSDRSRFQYFRSIDGEQERYVLTYGDFATVQTAMGALATVDFGLPSSVKPFPERFSSYQPYVTDQGSDERVVGGAGSRAYQVRLREVAIPVPVYVPTAPTAPRSTEPALGHLGNEKALSTSPSDSPVQITPTLSSPKAPLQSQPLDDSAVQDPFG